MGGGLHCLVRRHWHGRTTSGHGRRSGRTARCGRPSTVTTLPPPGRARRNAGAGPWPAAPGCPGVLVAAAPPAASAGGLGRAPVREDGQCVTGRCASWCEGASNSEAAPRPGPQVPRVEAARLTQTIQSKSRIYGTYPHKM